jgi:tetratricopeptide (TPR) repeat protein
MGVPRDLRLHLAPLLLSFLLLSLLLDVSGPRASLAAQDEVAPAQEKVDQVTRTLREHYYDRAWELGSMQGAEWNEKAPDAIELRAWYAMNLARDGRSSEAIEIAENLVERAPENPWAWFALAGALFRDTDRSEESYEPSRKAVTLAPENLDVLSLRADIIRSEESQEAAMAFVDSLPPELGSHPLLQIRKAVAMDRMAGEEEDSLMQAEAHDLFREVMARDTTFLEPPFFLGSRLRGPQHLDESLALLERAAALSPSHEVHRFYWRTLQGRRDVSPEEKTALVEGAIEAFFQQSPETPGALYSVAGVYDQLGQTEKRDSLWERIMELDPDSRWAEWVLVSRYRELNRELGEAARAGEEEDPELKARYRAALETFLMRPEFHRETLRGDAYRNLLYLLRDQEGVDPDFLYQVVRGVELYEGINTHIIHGMAPTILADRGAHLDYAEELARQGLAKVEEQMEEYRERGLFDSEEEFEEARGGARSRILDALGWVQYAQGRLDEAEETLLEAHQLAEKNVTVLLHLGKLYEARHEQAVADGDDTRDGSFLAQAQDFYLKGSLIPQMAENPNEEALRTVYEKRHGSLDGFDAYFADAEKVGAGSRKEEILGERLDEPLTLGAFALETLAGDTVTSEILEGKVAVINFWGTWCGPCKVELPGIQEFHDQVKGDDTVVFLTIANDGNPDVVRKFMEVEGYTFPVLIDNGYVSEMDVTAFPTTWFTDGKGKIWFEKRGWSVELAQEFGWRVEALRAGGAS